MTFEEVLKLKKGFDEAETEEPFLYADKDDLKVVGDPNKTELKKYTYKLTFETDEGKVEKVYENIHVAPRKRIKVTRLFTKMLPYFRKAKEDGTVSENTNEEVAMLFLGMDDEIYDICYDLAEEVLGVPAELKDFIDPISAIAFGTKLIMDNPAVAKEAEMSFG